MIALLQEAFKDENNYKFIFLSDSCIPIKSFNYIYNYLTVNNYSYINHIPNKKKNKFNDIYHTDNIYVKDIQLLQNNFDKSPQWIILNRKHTKIIIDTNNFYMFLKNAYLL